MVESIVGFFLFSSILLLYLPSYYTELNRMNQIILRTEQWRIFNDLVQIDLDLLIDEESRAHQKQLVIELWEFDQNQSIEYFYCDDLSCLISFSEGSNLYVEIQEIQQ